MHTCTCICTQTHARLRICICAPCRGFMRSVIQIGMRMGVADIRLNMNLFHLLCKCVYDHVHGYMRWHACNNFTILKTQKTDVHTHTHTHEHEYAWVHASRHTYTKTRQLHHVEDAKHTHICLQMRIHVVDVPATASPSMRITSPACCFSPALFSRGWSSVVLGLNLLFGEWTRTWHRESGRVCVSSYSFLKNCVMFWCNQDISCSCW